LPGGNSRAGENPLGQFEVGGLVDIDGTFRERQENRFDFQPQSSRGGNESGIKRKNTERIAQ
jgi:hypothetical protein